MLCHWAQNIFSWKYQTINLLIFYPVPTAFRIKRATIVGGADDDEWQLINNFHKNLFHDIK